jgi:KDO2-lipid IV(A) lauroyltransferase
VLLVRAVALLPRRVALALGARLAGLLGAFAKRKRKRAAFNFRRAGIGDPEQAARRAFRNIGANVCEMLWVFGRPVEESARCLRVNNLELIEDTIKRGQGVLVVTAHTGNWELGGLFGTRAGLPVAVIARELRTPRLERLIHDFRARAGIRTLLRGADGTSVAAMRWLARGKVLCCMMDRASSGRRVSVPLIWGRMNIPLGPIELAQRTKVPIVLGSSRRCADTLIEVTFRLLDTSDAEGPRAIAAAVGKALEDELREQMDQWFWVYRREPEPGVYVDADDELASKQMELG